MLRMRPTLALTSRVAPSFFVVTIPARSARSTSRSTVGMLEPTDLTNSERL